MYGRQYFDIFIIYRKIVGIISLSTSYQGFFFNSNVENASKDICNHIIQNKKIPNLMKQENEVWST